MVDPESTGPESPERTDLGRTDALEGGLGRSLSFGIGIGTEIALIIY